MKNLFLLLLALPFFIACNSTVNIFGSWKTPHEMYADKIEDSPAGKQWITVADNILYNTQEVRLPYKQLGYFPNDKPRALALEFAAKRGEQVHFELQTSKATGSAIFADIYKENGTDVTHIMAADKDSTRFNFDVEETGKYILRLQPQLESNTHYDLSIATSPSLGFPVAGTKARVGSVWGDSRDNGKRSHEGIDIFAAKLTPAIAAANGYISSVRDGGLGGKTVNLKVEGRNLSLYYAHLDKQLVEEGQYVKKGDTIGLVGNTGNARTTPPHLHFGIYTFGGAIDPLPFVNKINKTTAAPVAKDLTKQLQLTKAIAIKNRESIKPNTLLTPLAITPAGYLAELADGTIIEAPLKSVRPI